MLKKGFESPSKDEVVWVVAKIESRNYNDQTKQTYKIVLKRLYRCLRGSNDCPSGSERKTEREPSPRRVLYSEERTNACSLTEYIQ